MKSYRQGLKVWSKWCHRYQDVLPSPAKAIDFTFFIVPVVQENGRYRRIQQAFNAVSWLHKIAGAPNPCDTGLMRSVKEAAKRILKKPTIKKCPIKPRHLRLLVHNFATSDLKSLRVPTIALLSYAGFLRYDEAIKIRRSDIQFKHTFLTLFVESSKTDQERNGETVYIARTRKATCPYDMLRSYISIANIPPDDDNYIFRPLVRLKAGHRMKDARKPISYTTARECVMEAIGSIGLNRKMFGTHSFRRGGATQSAKRGISDRLFKKHGRWKSDNAKDGYVSEDLAERLSVTRNLGI